MSHDTALDDDYVISLLKRDAANTKGGLSGLASRRPHGNAPKPNTRFLRQIIKETDSHNAALKAKEERDAKFRLREAQSEDMGRKRRRDDDEERVGKRRKEGGDRPDRWAKAFGGLNKQPDRRERKTQTARPREETRDRRHDDRSSRREEESRHEPHPNHNESRREPSKRVSSPSRSNPSDHRKHRRRRRSSSASASDPLADLIGPAPPPITQARGRGAAKSSSMDARFPTSYDPKADVGLEPSEEEGDDWDMALEALRDRTKWRLQGAERLRAAGFTPEEVATWEKGRGQAGGGGGGGGGGDGGEKDVGDVRWVGRGEGREWDRGKVLDGLGSVRLEAAWAKEGT